MIGQKSILLGNEKKTGRDIYIDPKTRTTHMHIIGSTGVGKSKFMEHLVREDILNNNGLCLIDPHGYLYDDIVNWCETKRFLGRKKILLFDPTEEGQTFAFNPLHVASSTAVSFHVDCMVQACAKVWGGEDTDKTPLLKRCLRVIFHILAEKKMSLLETQYFISPENSEPRKYITNNIQDHIIRQQWDYFKNMNDRQFYETFGSTINRMMEFLHSPIIRNIVGQTERTIDFRKIMDEGYVLLVNLASKNNISDDNARLLGTLIVNDLFINAQCRPKGSRPFYLYIDECARFINDDIGRILDEGRKFGLHLTLAHQYLSQLKKAGDDIYSSVMTDAKTKVVFGGLDIEDAEVLARKMFLGELDLEEPKVILNKQTVVGYLKTWLQSHSHSSGSASGEGHVTSRGTSGPTADPLCMESSSDADSSSQLYTESDQEGFSETFLPELEERPTQVYNLEEQVYKAMDLMVNQLTQNAIIKMPDSRTILVKTPTVEPGFASEARVRRFKEECYKLADFVKPDKEAKEHVEKRFLDLKQVDNNTSSATHAIPRKSDPVIFRDTKKPKPIKE